jgi:hypothetical protein
MSKNEDNRPRLKCTCPVCGNIFYACKSILMEAFGVNSGSGSCPECSTFFHLEADENNKSMVLTKWDDYLKERKDGVENV